jgi:hypothetical protein
MPDFKDKNPDNPSLLDAVVGLLNSQREGNIDLNTLVSLLTLCNLMGIVSFLNNQVQFDFNTTHTAGKSTDKAAMISSLLSMINSQGGEGKISPQMLIPMLKMLNSSGGDEKIDKLMGKLEQKKEDA